MLELISKSYLINVNTFQRASAASQSTGAQETECLPFGNFTKSASCKTGYVWSVHRSNKSIRHRKQMRNVADHEKLGCPQKYLNMITMTSVAKSSDLSEPFSIINVQKPGCVLAPIIFIIFFSMILWPWKFLMNGTGSTSNIALMAACLIYEDYRPT